MTSRALAGARPSPNIWGSPATYETENRAFDRAGVLAATLRRLADWAGRDVVDVGCGTGYHLPEFADTARSVTGVEPHADLLAIAARRTRRRSNVRVLPGLADDLPLPASSVDVAHARWAYFFGPGSEPGLAELERVVRRGGTAFVVDNDPTRSTFGRWFTAGFPNVDAAAVERFWTRRGWSRERLDLAWTFDDRADLEAVVRLELPPAAAERALAEQERAEQERAEHGGLRVDYAVNLWWRRF
ncbi:MAG: class I SAM-dependent methyltransferase [Marmoricola sp.]